MTDVNVYCDGASRGNPGPSAWAYHVIGQVDIDGSGVLKGDHTNNEAEYHAVIEALRCCQLAKLPSVGVVNIITDSELVVKQLRKEYTVKSPRLQELYRQARVLETDLLTRGIGVRYVYLPRDDDMIKVVDRECNRRLDTARRR